MRAHRPTLRALRSHRWWIWGLVLWVMAPMSLLALPVDWAEICGCDACPFEGGPSCCCRKFPTFDNADGSAGKRAGIATPSVHEKEGCAASTATLTIVESWKVKLSRASMVLRPPDLETGRAHRQSTELSRATDWTLHLLPRPPPSP